MAAPVAGRILIVLLLAACFAADALAQPAMSSSRRDELAKVDELVNDPDPLTRLANMEAIVREGDALKVQRAIRLAISSDDRDLRALGMKAFLARTVEVTFALAGEAQDMRDLQRAATDRERAEVTRRRGGYLAALDRAKFNATFFFSYFNIASGKGEVTARRNTTISSPFLIVGDRLRFNHRLGLVATNCDIEIRPTKELRLLGTAACQRRDWPAITMTAPMD